MNSLSVALRAGYLSVRTAEGASEKQSSLKACLRNGLTYLLIVVLLFVVSAARSKKKKGPAGAADKKAAAQAAVPKTESKKATVDSDVVPEATEYVFVTVNMK